VSSAAITLCVASQQVFIVVDFVIYSVRKLLDTPSYMALFVRAQDQQSLYRRAMIKNFVPGANFVKFTPNL
jgi:hypothetical protein